MLDAGGMTLPAFFLSPRLRSADVLGVYSASMAENLELMLAWRHLHKRRGERFISLITWLSVGGVTLGVASLIIVFSVMTGYKEKLRDKIVGMNSHVTAYPLRRSVELPEAAALALAIPGLTEVSPFVMGQAMVSSGKSARGVAVRGLDPDSAAFALTLGGKPTRAAGGVYLGAELARELKVGAGDSVRLTVPSTGVPRLTPFRVAGVFYTGMFEYDSKMVVTTLADAQALFGLESPSGLEIRVDDIYAAEEYAAKVGSALGPQFSVADWKAMNHNMFYALELQRVVLSLIMGLVVVVAAFNVAATLILVVLEKTREIGILKAMGASGGTIRRIFALEGLLVGVGGALLGSALGLGACFVQSTWGLVTIPSDIYLFSELPVKVDPLVSFVFAISAVALCFGAAVYPSWRASRLDPVDAIRME